MLMASVYLRAQESFFVEKGRNNKKGNKKMSECIVVGIGGFIGSVCRYLIGLLPYKMESGFPIKTLLINTIGAFMISMFASWISKGRISNSHLELMLKVGLCGGFTTFSTFAYETNGLMSNGNHITAILYVVLSVILGIFAVSIGQWIA